ncbi:DNA pilot protein [Sigmofec virus UA08Rod_4343]|uniref:DNA pilot protein n=1 Tax=Sigmofec virus UA08Rod_4343 TaxID=2929400 RepID=A0A976N247_9VIRU|nr:DNA pilot protein [Sigmofec virus UA08Rod_4343]
MIGLALGIGSLAAGLIGSFLNYQSNKNTNKVNKQLTESTNAQNQANFDKQFEYAQMQDKRDFEYTQFLNQQSQSNFENQFSIAANDAAKAGINPLALNGASAGSASFQGSSAASMPGSPNLQSPRMVAGDYSQLGSVVDSLLNYKIQDKTLKQQKELAEDQMEIQQYNAETQRTQAENLATIQNYQAHKTPVDSILESLQRLETYGNKAGNDSTGNSANIIDNTIKAIDKSLSNVHESASKTNALTPQVATADDLIQQIEKVPEKERELIFGKGIEEKVSKLKGLIERWFAAKHVNRGIDTYNRLQSLQKRENREY